QVDRGGIEDAVLVGGAHVADVGGTGRDRPDRALDVRVRQGTLDHCGRSTFTVRSPIATVAPAGSTVAVCGTRFSRVPSARTIADPLVEARSVTVTSSPVPSMRRWVFDTDRVSSVRTNST